jgi:hypothetical protein
MLWSSYTWYASRDNPSTVEHPAAMLDAQTRGSTLNARGGINALWPWIVQPSCSLQFIPCLTPIICSGVMSLPVCSHIYRFFLLCIWIFYRITMQLLVDPCAIYFVYLYPNTRLGVTFWHYWSMQVRFGLTPPWLSTSFIGGGCMVDTCINHIIRQACSRYFSRSMWLGKFWIVMWHLKLSKLSSKNIDPDV